MTKLANKTRLEDETLLKFAQGEGKPKRGEDLKIIYLIQSTFRLWPQQKDELGWKVETNGDFPQFLLQRGADDTFLSSIQTTAPLKCVGFRYFFHSLNNCIESFFFIRVLYFCHRQTLPQPICQSIPADTRMVPEAWGSGTDGGF